MKTQPIQVALAATLGILMGTGFLAAPSSCLAQWVPRAGDGTLSVVYEYTRVTDHLFSQNVDGLVDPASGYVGGPDNHFYLGDVFGQSINVSADYGVWNNFAASASVTYVTSKYNGRSPESPDDDGSYHGSFQDGVLTVRYMFPWEGFAITPTVGYRLPLTDYPTMGHVSVGKGQRELPVGIIVGRSLSPFLPRAYLSGAYTYAFVENLHGYSLDQRHYDLTAGYILSRTVSFGGYLQYLDTVDGIDWLTDIVDEESFMNHDAAAKTQYLHGGGSVSLSLGGSFGVTFSYVGTISGKNTHAGQSVSVAPTWGFRSPFSH